MAPKAVRRDDDEEEYHPAKMQRGSVDPDMARKAKLKAYIIGLNNQFASWIHSQASDQLWSDGVRDYLRHVDGLLADFRDVVPTTGKTNGAPPPSFGAFSASNGSNGRATSAEPAAKTVTFSFPSGPSAPPAAPESAATAPAPFAFGSASANAAKAASIFGGASSAAAAVGEPHAGAGMPPKKPSFSFLSEPPEVAPEPAAAAPTAAPSSLFSFGGPAKPAASEPSGKAPVPFSFGGAAASSAFAFGASASAASAPAAATAPFSFGGASAATTASTSAFSFGAPAAASIAAAASSGSAAAPAAFSFGAPASFGGGAAEAEEGEGEEEPQKFQSEVAVSEESGNISFKGKAKFSHLAQGSWESKGVGTMMLRVRNDGSNKPFVTFTTEAGRVLYIANVSKSMQVILVEGRNNVTFAAPWSPDGQATPTLQNVMFMLPKGRNLEFKAEVEKLQAAM